MGTTADKLQRLVEGKQAIVDAVNSKANTSLTINSKLSDVASSISNIKTQIPDSYIDLAEKYELVDILQTIIDTRKSCFNLFYLGRYTANPITDVDFLSRLDTSNVTNMSYMFNVCQKITTIPQLDTSNVTNMKGMFFNCSGLTSIPQLDTSKVTNMQEMFNGCQKLTTAPQLDTSKVTNMGYMFNFCNRLTTATQITTTSATDMSNMFYNCSKLTIIDITYYNLTGRSTMFAYRCSALKSLIIREFGANYVLSSNAFLESSIESGTGYIYVPRSMVSTLQSATNWSTHASQIRALEDYTVDGTTTGALDETKI